MFNAANLLSIGSEVLCNTWWGNVADIKRRLACQQFVERCPKGIDVRRSTCGCRPANLVADSCRAKSHWSLCRDDTRLSGLAGYGTIPKSASLQTPAASGIDHHVWRA